MDEENEVKDPTGLLAAYNNLKEELKKVAGERDAAKSQVETLTEQAKEDSWRKKALSAETKAALQAAGIKDSDKVLKYVSTEGIDFDDEGNLKGFDEKLKEWKADLPAVFDAKVRAGGKADMFAKDEVEPKTNPLADAVHRAMN